MLNVNPSVKSECTRSYSLAPNVQEDMNKFDEETEAIKRMGFVPWINSQGPSSIQSHQLEDEVEAASQFSARESASREA